MVYTPGLGVNDPRRRCSLTKSLEASTGGGPPPWVGLYHTSSRFNRSTITRAVPEAAPCPADAGIGVRSSTFEAVSRAMAVRTRGGVFDRPLSEIATAAGVSRTMVGHVITALRRQAKLELVAKGGGRGRSSVYQWRDTRFLRRFTWPPKSTNPQKLQPPTTPLSRTALTPSEVHAEGPDTPIQALKPKPYRFLAACFRRLFTSLDVSAEAINRTIGIVLAELKGATVREAQLVWARLKRVVDRIDVHAHTFRTWMRELYVEIRHALKVERAARAEAEALDAECSEAEAQARDDVRAMLDRGQTAEILEAFALAFEGLHGRPPSDAERSAHLERVRAEVMA